MVNGTKIKQLMNEKRISNKEMAHAVGVSDSMISFITQELREPGVTVLARIAKKLDCTVDDLIKR